MSQERPEPVHEVRTARLLIRSYERNDVEVVDRVVKANIEALSPWMPWVHDEPISLQTRAAQLRSFRANFDRGEDFIYGIFDAATAKYLGGTGLHRRVGPKALEVGYWVSQEHWGKGIAREAVRALTKVAFTHFEVSRVVLRIEEANEKSLRVARAVGFVEEGKLRGGSTLNAEGEQKSHIVFGLHRDDEAAQAILEESVELYGFLPGVKLND